MSFYCIKDVTARKPHTCKECGVLIVKGEVYEKHFWSDESVGGAKLCKTCSPWLEALWVHCHKSHPDFWPTIGRIDEYLTEVGDQIGSYVHA